MSISAGVPNQTKLDALVALCPPGNTYKCALYTSAANLGAASTTYTTSGEVSSAGYTAGGATLSGLAQSLDGSVAIMDFNDPSWTGVTFTVRGATIYDSTTGKVRAVLDFGQDYSPSSGPFTVVFPAPAAATALIRVS